MPQNYVINRFFFGHCKQQKRVCVFVLQLNVWLAHWSIHDACLTVGSVVSLFLRSVRHFSWHLFELRASFFVSGEWWIGHICYGWHFSSSCVCEVSFVTVRGPQIERKEMRKLKEEASIRLLPLPQHHQRLEHGTVAPSLPGWDQRSQAYSVSGTARKVK